MSYKSTRALVVYGNVSAENLTILQTAYNAAVTAFIAGNGSQVVSASTNGASFTFAQGLGAMTNESWMVLLSEVLEYISTETMPKNVSIARVC